MNSLGFRDKAEEAFDLASNLPGHCPDWEWLPAVNARLVEIKSVNPKGDQPWIFIGRTDVKAEAPILWSLDVKWKSLSRVWLFATSWTIESRNSLGQNTGVGSLSLFQGIFPTQELNPGLPLCRWIPYQLSHQGSLGFIWGLSVLFRWSMCLFWASTILFWLL